MPTHSELIKEAIAARGGAWNKGISRLTAQHVRDKILLDPEDKYILDLHYWTITNLGYVRGRNLETGIMENLHRVVMQPRRDQLIDHINSNKLDNRRANLRVATQMQNQQNRGIQQNNKSGYKGVVWNRAHSKWHAYVRVETKLKHLGYFSDILEAAQAYNVAARKHFGPYARINDL